MESLCKVKSTMKGLPGTAEMGWRGSVPLPSADDNVEEGDGDDEDDDDAMVIVVLETGA